MARAGRDEDALAGHEVGLLARDEETSSSLEHGYRLFDAVMAVGRGAGPRSTELL